MPNGPTPEQIPQPVGDPPAPLPEPKPVPTPVPAPKPIQDPQATDPALKLHKSFAEQPWLATRLYSVSS